MVMVEYFAADFQTPIDGATDLAKMILQRVANITASDQANTTVLPNYMPRREGSRNKPLRLSAPTNNAGGLNAPPDIAGFPLLHSSGDRH